MAMTLDQLEDKLLSLPESNRLRLAATLLESLPVPEGALIEGTPECEAEIARRCKEMRDGSVEMIPHDVVMQELEEMLQQG